MKVDELVTQLHILGVNKNSYSLGALRNSDCNCVIREADLWVSDRPSMLASFTDESDAYDFVLMQFKKWLSRF